MCNIYRGPAILVSDWLISKKVFSKTAQLDESKLGRKHLLEVLYKDCSFRPDAFTNMAATGNSCFLLVNGSKRNEQTL
jgi:hypothetical protein